MSVTLNPYINFRDTAREALDFYHGIFGGDLTVSTFGEFGMTDPGVAEGVMHGQITSETVTLMASDTPPGMDYTPGSSIGISLSGDDADTLRGYFASLSEGGAVATPLEVQMWGDEFGMLTDRFGVNWVVNISVAQPEKDSPTES